MISSQSSFKKRVKSKKELNTFSRTKKFFVYDFIFEQHLIDRNVYSHEYDYNDDDCFVYSNDWEKINEKLAQSRLSLSSLRFFREEFRKFNKINMQALTKDIVMTIAFSIIIETINIASQKNFRFENLKHLIDDSIIKT